MDLAGAQRAAVLRLRCRPTGAPSRRSRRPRPLRRPTRCRVPQARHARETRRGSPRGPRRPSARAPRRARSSRPGRSPGHLPRSRARLRSPGSPPAARSRATERFRPTPITAHPSRPRSVRDSIRTPASFRVPTQTSLGHLTAHSTEASDSAASHTASGTASGSRGAFAEGAQQRGIEERRSRSREPAAPLAPAAGVLFVSGHDQAAGCAGLRQLPGARVGRVGQAEVAVGRSEAGHAGRSSTSESGLMSSSPAALPLLTASASRREESS